MLYVYIHKLLTNLQCLVYLTKVLRTLLKSSLQVQINYFKYKKGKNMVEKELKN